MLKITVQTSLPIFYLISSSQAATNIPASVQQAISGYHSGLKIVFLVILVLNLPQMSFLDHPSTSIKYSCTSITSLFQCNS